MRLMSRAALAVAAILFAAPALHAQTSFSLAAGATMPLGTTGDAYDVGYNATLGVGVKPPLAPLGVRIEGMFNSMEGKSNTPGVRMLAGIVNATLSGVGMPIPMAYLIGGLGMYNSKATNLPTGLTADAETDFGFNIGAGLNIPLTGFGTFIEARYHHIPVEGGSVKFVPISVGIKF
ncbi:MAG: outer membrane beta-barrel protein [Gemmatimonadaceae bacterium]